MFAYVLMIFAIIGIFFSFTNLIPLQIGGIPNDGLNARNCKTNPQTRRAMWIQLKYAALLTQGVTPRNMPEEWTQNIGEITDGILGFLPCLHYNRLMDHQSGEDARAYLQHVLDNPGKMADLHQNELRGELLFHELINENRAEIVESMYTPELQANMKLLKTHLSLLRLQYAYTLLYSKDGQKAKKIRETFDKTCKTTPFAGDIDNERYWMQMVNFAANPH